MVALGLMLAGRVAAQTFTVLHSFAPASSSFPGTNSDGVNPFAGLILVGNTLYGTAPSGGTFGGGTVFKINVDGSDFVNLYNFGTVSGDGPNGGLVLSSNRLYGTTFGGGTQGWGMVFALNIDGQDFAELCSFSFDGDGVGPVAGLVLDSNTLFGTTLYNPQLFSSGSVFAVNTDGTGFETVHTFTSMPSGANGDGAWPRAPLALSGTTLFGTAEFGGTWGNGTLFKLNTVGSVFMALHDFTATAGTASTNSDGARPFGGLVLSGSTLYGTSRDGGDSGNGAVFSVNTDGTAFKNLHSFTASSGSISNSDGAVPYAGLVLSGNTLYGTTSAGGNYGEGTLFALSVDGARFTTLYSFTGGSDGAAPSAPLFLSGSTLYGTAQYGGSWGDGTVFSLSFTPQLTITPAAANVILTWPTNVAGFDYTGYFLQTTTNLASPIWVTNSATPVLVNGQYTVTNPVSSTQEFFRLSQ
jgi:uncharacterized repeat protein (TIGR03803 family)